MRTLLQDLRYGLRMLAKRPGFTALAVIPLALGIGANTAIFSVINSVLLRPLPYKDPGQLIMVWESNPHLGYALDVAAPANFLDWKSQNQVFEQMAAFFRLNLNLTGEGEPERIAGQAVSADFFPLLGITPTVGRAFRPDEDQPGHDDVAVISHALWQPRPEIYVPASQEPAPFTTLIVRAAPDPMRLTAALRHAVQEVDKNQPVYNIRAIEQYLSDSVAQPRFRSLLLGLFAAVALVLAAVGIYGVLAYSVTQRTHEIGLRMALGAQPQDVLKLVVGQGMRLTLLGVAIGLAAAFALTRVLSRLLYEVSATDPATFAGIAFLLAGVALVASYIPARRATKVDPIVALHYE